MIRRLKNRCRNIKWWIMRANRKLPPCDWWDFKYTLADVIKQGLEGLLNSGATDWQNDKDREKNLRFVLEWAKDFPRYDSAIVAIDDIDWVVLQRTYQGDRLILTKSQLKEWKNRQQQAIEILGKELQGLWD